MAIKRVVYRSSGKRTRILVDYKSLLTQTKPEKSLLQPLKKNAGRNNQGRITKMEIDPDRQRTAVRSLAG